jgi:hypothetical protein
MVAADVRRESILRVLPQTLWRFMAAGSYRGRRRRAIADRFGSTPLKIVAGLNVFCVVYIAALAGLGELRP